MSERSEHVLEIHAVLDRYADALDGRAWDLLDHVFSADAVMDYGAWRRETRDEIVTTIRSYLDGCGPTQHLQGNYRVELADDCETARSRVYVRAMHLGIGAAEGKTYEMGGEYRDNLIRTADGWRSRERFARPRWELGDRSVLQAG